MRKSLLSAVAETGRKPNPVQDTPAPQPAAAAPSPKRATRAHLKHIGAYLDDETVERVAILRARLRLDNSQLVKLAIDDLFDRRRAEGAFKA